MAFALNGHKMYYLKSISSVRLSICLCLIVYTLWVNSGPDLALWGPRAQNYSLRTLLTFDQ